MIRVTGYVVPGEGVGARDSRDQRQERLMSRRRRENRSSGNDYASVHALERRVLLAQVAWDGDAHDGQWNTPANWSTDRTPGLNDEVTINFADTFTVTLAGAPASVASLTLGSASGNATQTLAINAALTLGSQSVVNASGLLQLNPGGTIGGSGALDID